MPWLVLSWLVIVLSGASAVLLRSQSPWWRLLLSLASVVALTLLISPIIGSTMEPRFLTDAGTFELLSEKLFVAAWWLLLARIVVIAGQIILRINHQHHAARLALDLAAGAIYLTAVIAITDIAFGISVTGLVATSGIIAIVLGLALQNTLGDLFSGIAIGIDRPFKVGDLIWIEGSIEGRVIETNWRSTRIATGANDIATVPNSVVAKSRILNRSSPTETRTETVKVILDAAVPPKRGVALLRAAALNTSALALHPAPKAVCMELSGDGASYEISFSASLSSLGNARSDLLEQVARHARYAGIALATQNGTPLIPRKAPDLLQLLAETDVLEALTPDERALLASRIVAHRGEPGDTIFNQGGALSSLFIIANGTFEVTRDDGEGSRRLGTIGPGDYFGELALLIGDANVATVTALTPFLAYEVGKAMISPLLHENPALLHAFEKGAAKAQALLERTIAVQTCPRNIQNSHLFDRIRTFFNMKENGGTRPNSPKETSQSK